MTVWGICLGGYVGCGIGLITAVPTLAIQRMKLGVWRRIPVGPGKQAGLANHPPEHVD